MKAWLLALALGANVAVADDPLPTYLPDLKGAVLNDLVKSAPFELTAGRLKKCIRKEVVDMVFHDCSVEGASALVKDEGGESRTFAFDEVRVWFKYLKSFGGHINEYHYKGYWRGTAETVSLASPVVLKLWYPRSTPDRVKGYLELTDYGLSRAIHAKP